MKTSARRWFLGLVAGSIAALSLPGSKGAGAEPLPPDPSGEKPTPSLAGVMNALNETAGLGIPPEEVKRAERYATGVYGDLQSKLRPIHLGEDLPLRFSAKRKP